MTQQAIIEMAAGTDLNALTGAFAGMVQLMELKDVSLHQMPATRDFGGKMLVHMEAKQVENITDVIQMLCISMGWTLKASQTSRAYKQYDELGNPVMVESGYYDGQGNPIMIHQNKANVDIPLSESYFINFMPDVDEIGTRPTVANPHQIAGAEPWELTV